MIDPLWRAMYREDAWCIQPDEYQDSIAPVIRAMRDWLVPEEPGPTGMQPASHSYSARELERKERQRLRALLTAEAERAEKQL